MDKLKCGIIGTGGIAYGKHLPNYAQHGKDVEIYALCDIDPSAMEKAARQYGVKHLFQDYRDMLKLKELDFVCVCLPNYLHRQATIDSLLAGKHVHCEKPMALNAAEAREMIQTQKKTGKVLMVGLNNRFTRESQYVKNYISGGELGEIYHVDCGWKRKCGLPPKAWFADKNLSGGGPFIDLGVHYLDLALYFMGYPSVQSISGCTYSRFGNTDLRKLYSYRPTIAEYTSFSVEDLACGFVRTQGGASIHFEFSWASNTENEHLYYELLGSKGGIRFDITDKKTLKIFTIIGNELATIEPDINPVLPVETEPGHFINCIRENKQPEIVKLEDCERMMEIIDMFYQSAAVGHEIAAGEKMQLQ